MTEYVLGLDPGLSGAIAWIDRDGGHRFYNAIDMPVMDGRVNAAELSWHIEDLRPAYAVVEQVGSMPGQGVASTFKFGMSYGIALGVLGAMEIPIVHVRPARWKKFFSIGSDKEKGRALAIDTWPEASTFFSRKKDHGRAEAALLALWGIKNK